MKVEIGYINSSETEQDKEYREIKKHLRKNQAIHTCTYVKLFEIITELSLEGEIKIYVFSINSLGITHEDLIGNLKKIKEYKNEQNVNVYFISEKIDTSKKENEIDTSTIEIDSIISLLVNRNNIISTPIKNKVGRPLGSINKENYNKFRRLYPEEKSVSKLAGKIGVTKRTIYQYIKRITQNEV